jgi:hypothetical protein
MFTTDFHVHAWFPCPYPFPFIFSCSCDMGMGMDADADMGRVHELSIIGFGISDQIFPELSWLDRRVRKTPGTIRHRIKKSNNRISAIKKTLGCQAQFFLYIKNSCSVKKSFYFFAPMTRGWTCRWLARNGRGLARGCAPRPRRGASNRQRRRRKKNNCSR